MIKVILNEKQIGEMTINAQSERRLDYSFKQNLVAGAKYLHQILGESIDDTEKDLIEILGRIDQDYSLSYWRKIVRDAVKHADDKMIDIPYIPITKAELEVIDSLDHKMERQVAFAYLCLAKYRDAINPDNNHWVSYKYNDVFQLANTRLTNDRKLNMLHKFNVMGILRISRKVSSTSFCLDWLGDVDQSKVVLKVDDFRDLGYTYLKYKGENFGRCKVCGRLIRQNKHKTNKYCRSCKEKYYNKDTGRYYVSKKFDSLSKLF
jgi:hypothetical protein